MVQDMVFIHLMQDQFLLYLVYSDLNFILNNIGVYIILRFCHVCFIDLFTSTKSRISGRFVGLLWCCALLCHWHFRHFLFPSIVHLAHGFLFLFFLFSYI